MIPAITRVGIVGGGAEAWLAAAALRRAFRRRGLEVTVLDTGMPADAPVGRWTLPSQRGMHALLGLQESELLRRTGASFKLATEHTGWQGPNRPGETSRFLHAHGDIGTELGGTPFYKYLLREAIRGRPENAEAYSVAAVAARLGRFARPMGADKDLTSSFTYGFHLEEAAYTAWLRSHALDLGVRRLEAGLTGLERLEDGRIGALRAANGESVAADLFLDCSGNAALLIGQLVTEREDWSGWLPCDRMISALAPPNPDASAVTHTLATDAGWLWHAPLAGKSMAGYCYCSAYASQDAALGRLRQWSRLEGEPRTTALASGRLRQFWRHNCVALGGAAMQLEPLAGAGLHFAQLGLGTLIELLPLATPNESEGAEFNRVMAEHADALRDFTIAHYRVGKAPAGEFWEARARATAPPERLAHKLDLFQASGRINLLDFETFEETDWAWLLMGAKVTPAALELQISLRIENVTPPQVAPLRTYIERLAASMPRHTEFIQRLQSQATHAAKH